MTSKVRDKDRDYDTRTLVIERELPHSIEDVWLVLTESALIDEWLMSNDLQPVVGHRFSFRTAPTPHWDGIVEGEVLRVELHRRLAYSWNAAGGLRTTVAWTLEPTGNGTRLRLEQSGFGPDNEANYRGAKYGWQKFLDAMERVLGKNQ